ncbi:PilN domain-containing protein [Brumicola nitratireducens]|uniref:Type IV pilus biogenesis protein PilN n=1 Tax=Glaciecola nitratireducens (strain JCM 12485 / KCTC 12276 / FR1064) TaxID=1085623 RepID=G4QFK3_GLANF|nr:PilN domain-containing protein [Glaciecola nitratireducens]AEP28628.1 type IV pilus biogenesis protein PilN [Glaciecola nitratireducens FR1064]
MAHVNLLPWREAQRQRHKKQYIGSLVVISILVLAVFWILGEVIEQQIRNQNSRNNYLEQQIGVLDTQIERIKDIRSSKAEIAQRMALIEQLQVSKNVSPIVFDELARIVPAGVSFEKLSRSGNLIEIVGISESNNRLSSFMRNLEQSDVFTSGILSSITADVSTSNAVSDFKLTFSITPKVAPVQNAETDEEGNR